MKVRQEILTGVISAAASVLIIFGAFSLALAEGMPDIPVTRVVIESTETATPQPATPTKTKTVVVIPATLTLTITATATQGPSATVTPTASPTPTITATVTQTKCPFPKGWVKYTVKDGDTLEKLADKRNTSIEKIKTGNCLSSDELPSGTVIYLPRLPEPSTSTPAPNTPTTQVIYCGPPPGWIIYIIQPGDTLYHISRMYSTTVDALMRANCLTSDLIRAGARLYVPNVPPILPTATKTATPKPTPIKTKTPTAVPSSTVAPIDTPTPTDTPPPDRLLV
jgi:LysM repeat protein